MKFNYLNATGGRGASDPGDVDAGDRVPVGQSAPGFPLLVLRLLVPTAEDVLQHLHRRIWAGFFLVFFFFDVR